MIAHILERFVIHVFSGASVLILALVGFWYMERKVRSFRLNGWMFFILPALVSFTLISFREIWDVSAGGPLIKSVTDWISWVIGIGGAAYGLYRLSPRVTQAVEEITELRNRK